MDCQRADELGVDEAASGKRSRSKDPTIAGRAHSQRSSELVRCASWAPAPATPVQPQTLRLCQQHTNMYQSDWTSHFCVHSSCSVVFCQGRCHAQSACSRVSCLHRIQLHGLLLSACRDLESIETWRPKQQQKHVASAEENAALAQLSAEATLAAQAEPSLQGARAHHTMTHCALR